MAMRGKNDVIDKTGSLYHVASSSEEERSTATGNMFTKFRAG